MRSEFKMDMEMEMEMEMESLPLPIGVLAGKYAEVGESEARREEERG